MGWVRSVQADADAAAEEEDGVEVGVVAEEERKRCHPNRHILLRTAHNNRRERKAGME